MEGDNNSVIPRQQKVRNAAEETDCSNASTLEKGDQGKATPRSDEIKGNDNSLNTNLPCPSNKNKGELEKKDETRTAQPPTLSKTDNSNKGSKDVQNKNSSSPRSLKRKKTRQQQQQQQQQQPSPRPTTHPQTPQNLTRKRINPYNVVEIWKRYDLTAIEMFTAHETAELKAVQKQIWKRKKIVPYSGISNNATLVD
jgi:hypothetical protein